MNIKKASKFKKDYKRYLSSGFRTVTRKKELTAIITALVNGEELDKKYKDHLLTGSWLGFRECHIEPDFLLIYSIDSNTLELTRLGSHSELFK